ncbi:MAG: hypothetical protein ACREJ2_15970 [Planctomycetota bacterium]
MLRDRRSLIGFCLLAALAAAALPRLSGAEIKLPVTADNSICCFPAEQKDNQGKAPRIKMKGIENLIVFNFDAAQLAGMRVTKATLHIRGTAKDMTVRHVGFSTICSPWNEGDSTDQSSKDGEPCFLTPSLGSKETWAGPESTFLDCYGGRGGTIWFQTFCTHDDKDWYTIDIDPRLIEACAAKLSYGLCMTDDNGQTGNDHRPNPGTNHDNNFFYSREQNNSAPYLVIDAAPDVEQQNAQAETLNLTVKPWQHGADFDTGGLEITWPGKADAAAAADVLGYRLWLGIDGGDMVEQPHWETPKPPPAGEAPRVLIRWLKPGVAVKAKIQVIGRNGKVIGVGEASGNVSPAFPVPAPLTFQKIDNPAGAPPSTAASTVWVIPDCTKANPLTGNVLEEPGVTYEGDPAGTYSQSNCVWSGKTSTVSLHSLQGEWIAFQVICQNKAADPVTYTVTPGDLTGPDKSTIPASAFDLSTLFYQHIHKDARGWYADPMLPLKAGATFTVPAKENAVPGQMNQAVYVECFVPKDAKPGDYTGTLAVGADKDSVTLNIALHVTDALMPNDTHFTWSLNAYNSPADGYGEADSPEFDRVEQAFYKMSHLHRADLAVLHYSHSGNHEPGTAPAIEGAGKEAHVKDWTGWDKRFGPILDGSLFKGTPREGTAMSHFYVNLCEHYPTPMTAYKWNDVIWEDHWKVDGPIEDGFDQTYKDAWVAVAKDYIKHAKDQHYLTPLQVYLNDKYFYKQYEKKTGKEGRGVCFWLLDEPMEPDDFSALEFFGKLLKKAQDGDRKTLYFRVDVSRPQWARDTLTHVVDLEDGGSAGDMHLLQDWRERDGMILWTYGGSPSSTQSGLAIPAQALDLYGQGFDGFVPWLSLGGPDNWKNFADTCLLYTGKPVGIDGPCASLRLKAYRRGEQDVEYVWLLAEKRGLLKDDPNRRQVQKLLAGAIQSDSKLSHLDAQGQVTKSFNNLRPDDFERLRIAIANELK